MIRWDDVDPGYAPLLKEGGATAVLLPRPDEPFSRACHQAGLEPVLPDQLQFLDLHEIDRAPPSPPTVLKAGMWPGISRGPNVEGWGEGVASASRQPWVDANGFWIGYLRALYPKRAPILGYLPDENAGLKPDRLVPFDSLELALIEAWVTGGNYVLAVEPRHKQALLNNDGKALAAWRQLGRTARWLREREALFRQPTLPIVTALVEPGEITAEFANLMYRNNVSPALAAVADPPAPDPSRLALVAVGIDPPGAKARSRILANTEAGCAVITDAPGEDAWWRTSGLKLVRSQEDRDFYSLGPGQIVAYKEPVSDPSEFALDVIDIVTHKRRAVRLWNAPAVVALATFCPRTGPVRGAALLHAVNYGSPIDTDVQARIQGVFTKATLLRPDADPLPLKPAKRGTTTEVMLPELRRLGVVVFS